MAPTVRLPTATEQSHAVPISTYVVKVVSRCNLNCSYCYMYNLADRTYMSQPAVMREDVTAALSKRVVAHAARHDIPSVHVILHGGEPLLLGKRRFRAWVEQVRGALEEGGVPSHFSVQSNGVLIDDGWIDLLADLSVNVGLSIDGPKRFHDRHRVDHQGGGSFDDVVAAIRRLQAHPRGPRIFANVLAVINTDIPPREMFALWQFLDVPGMDLLLPHATHENRPPTGAMSYGDWMVELFDLWFEQNRPDRRVRFFENILRLLFGHPMSTDNIGGRPSGAVVVETDGGIESIDAFKCCEHGLTKLGLNVLRNELDDARRSPIIRAMQDGVTALCATCQACDLRDVCGGGYMPHRFSRERRFDNPSVYCEDLQKLIRHIRQRVIESLPRELIATARREGCRP
ncbi:radical SAM protein [Sorangium cellulosum]|uniref:Radical SAM protein n=1 Tax=Sorangium cellulosum TaxID=56 RepID=A0A2L0EMD4_SORCE|nr:radical SAM protein [Sorangium cellulosum]